MQVPGYVLDIQLLLQDWRKENTFDFRSFKELWKERKFSFIHRGSAAHVPPREYTQALFQAGVQYLLTFDFGEQVGGLFMLYCLFHTQTNEPKQKISVSLKVWKCLLKLHDDLAQEELLDGLYIWKKMKMEEVYHFSCIEPQSTFSIGQQQPVPANSLPTADIINIETVTGVVDISEIENMANWYATEKAKLGPLLSQCNYLDANLVAEVKELLKQSEEREYVPTQLQTME